MCRVDAADFAYAKSRRYMFDPAWLSHDQAVRQLVEERERANQLALSDAFLASLGNRRLAARSGIGSYAFALNFPNHKIGTSRYTPLPSGARRCECCGLLELEEPAQIDLNVLNFERHKWGGVRRDNPIYAWLDLLLFRATPPVKPTDADKRIMDLILAAASSLPPNATAGTLENALTGVFSSSKYERRVVIEILAVCGILQPKNRSGYFGEFTMAYEREHTGQHLNDWCYPAIWWRGSDGVNSAAVASYFPDI